MRTLKTKLISESEAKSRSCLFGKIPPILRGTGENNYVCCACGNLLAESMEPDQIIGIAFKCPKCDNFSEI